jgi:tetratricopeptide (TPR) repeat protein
MRTMICRKQARKLTENPLKWDPPAPSTVYIRIKNIPYETFKTTLNQGLVTTELDQIRYRLERHIYCCEVCSKYVNDYCVITNRKTEPERICKSFFPKEEYIHLDARPGFEDSAGFRYLSEIGVRKSNVGELREKESKDEQEAGNSKTIHKMDLYEEGVTLYRQGRLKLALEVFENLLSENPQDFAVLFHKGNSLLKLKCYEEAIETFEEASRINSSQARLWTNIGYALAKLERFKQALEAFERSISLNPVQKNAWEGKEALLSRIHQCEGDLLELERALEKNPFDENALLEKGKIHLELGETEQARENFEKALKVKPDNPEALQLRGKIFFEMGLEKEALHAFEKAIRQKPDFPEAWYAKGRVLQKLDNPRGAENAFKIASELWENKGSKNKAERARLRVKKLNSDKK